MTATTDNNGWLTPEQLAEEMDRPIRWVQEYMASGDIPSVKIGNRRFFTPECRAELHRRFIERQREADDGWGQVTRSAS